MQTFKPTLADITAYFPESIYEPEALRDADDDGVERTETLESVEEPYQYELDELPARFPVPVVTVDGAPRTVIPWHKDAPPSTGQVAICFDYPLIEFAADDEGLPAEVTYTGLGHVITARFLNQLQIEITAIQEALANIGAIDSAGTDDLVFELGRVADTGIQDITLLFGDALHYLAWSNPDGGGGRFELSHVLAAPAFIGDGSGLVNIPNSHAQNTDTGTSAKSFRIGVATDLEEIDAALVFGQAGSSKSIVVGTSGFSFDDTVTAPTFAGDGTAITGIPQWGTGDTRFSIAAPTTGTNRVTLALAAPTGGSTNKALLCEGIADFSGATSAAGAVQIGGVSCFYTSANDLYVARSNTRFTASGRTIFLTVDSTNGARIQASVQSGDAFNITTSNNNADIVFTPHGTGMVRTGATFRAGGYQAADGTDGLTETVVITDSNGEHTLTFKNGLLVGYNVD